LGRAGGGADDEPVKNTQALRVREEVEVTNSRRSPAPRRSSADDEPVKNAQALSALLVEELG
jgi:hypothetical protein